jgi:hypothetical protein
VLFTDVVMPGDMTGDVLAREALLLRRGLGVLLTSGFAEASAQNGTYSPDLKGYNLLNKPYRKQYLAKKIREALRAAKEGS